MYSNVRAVCTSVVYSVYSCGIRRSGVRIISMQYSAVQYVACACRSAIIQQGFTCLRVCVSYQLLPASQATISSFPAECLPELIDLITKYAFQTVDTNISLSALGLLVRIAFAVFN